MSARANAKRSGMEVPQRNELAIEETHGAISG